MNPIYVQQMAQQMSNVQQAPIASMNPFQKIQYAFQAMRNPAMFAKRYFPDIPAQIMNDGNQVLQYLQQTRNISNDQIQTLVNQYPGQF